MFLLVMEVVGVFLYVCVLLSKGERWWLRKKQKRKEDGSQGGMEYAPQAGSEQRLVLLGAENKLQAKAEVAII